MNIPSNNFISYSKIDYKGTIFKIGNYVSSFKHDNIACLYEILEIIITNDSAVSFIIHQIELESYIIHMKAYEVNKHKHKI